MECVQVVQGFLAAKGKADSAGGGQEGLNHLVGCLHSLTSLRVALLSRLSSGELFGITHILVEFPRGHHLSMEVACQPDQTQVIRKCSGGIVSCGGVMPDFL